MIDETKLPEISPTPEELESLVGRITASEHFRRSPRQRQLLNFIAAEQFANRSREITEQWIGQRVFGRAEGYNQSEDNIVRVSVRQLRTRLKAHFENEGCHEPWRIEIPKGGYRLEFVPNGEKTIAPASELNLRSPILRIGWLVAALSCFICLAIGFWLGLAHRVSAASEPGKHATIPNADDSGVNELLSGSGRVNLVVADTGLLDLLAGRQVTLEEYVHPAQLSASMHLAAMSPNLMRDTLVTSAADISFVSRVLQSPGSLRDRVRVLHARNANANDFAADSAVILGGPRVNPWSEFFEGQLNFQFRYGEPGPGCIVNKEPRSSELAVYGSCGPGEGDEYARIAWLPNLNHSGRVLIVSGSGMLATENACDYLLTPGSAARLHGLLGSRNLRDVESFELLLQTQSRAGVPSGNQVLCSRVTMARTPSAR